MKKILLTFLLFASVVSFAQSMNQKPLFLMDGMIASKQLAEEDKANIVKMDVYKSSDKVPSNLKSFEAFATNGLTNITLKENYFDKVPLSKLNEQKKLPKNNPVYVDGNLFTNTELIIIGNVLHSIKVQEINGQKVVVIDTTPKVK